MRKKNEDLFTWIVIVLSAVAIVVLATSCSNSKVTGSALRSEGFKKRDNGMFTTWVWQQEKVTTNLISTIEYTPSLGKAFVTGAYGGKIVCSSSVKIMNDDELRFLMQLTKD